MEWEEWSTYVIPGVILIVGLPLAMAAHILSWW
jgi:hypothetical protein